MSEMKTFVKSDGVITFDGLPFVELPVSEIMSLGCQEPSKSGIVLANVRKTYTLSDAVASQLPGAAGNVNILVTFRIERTPVTQAEYDLVTRTAEVKEKNQLLKTAKEAAATEAAASLLQRTAVNTAVGIAKALQRADPIGEAIAGDIAARFGGHKALSSGQ